MDGRDAAECLPERLEVDQVLRRMRKDGLGRCVRVPREQRETVVPKGHVEQTLRRIERDRLERHFARGDGIPVAWRRLGIRERRPPSIGRRAHEPLIAITRIARERAQNAVSVRDEVMGRAQRRFRKLPPAGDRINHTKRPAGAHRYELRFLGRKAQKIEPAKLLQRAPIDVHGFELPGRLAVQAPGRNLDDQSRIAGPHARGEIVFGERRGQRSRAAAARPVEDFNGRGSVLAQDDTASSRAIWGQRNVCEAVDHLG